MAGVIILDLDGTLLDTRRRHHAAYAECLARLGGTPQTLRAFWAAKRRGASWARVLSPAFGGALTPGIEEAFMAAFTEAIESDRMLALDRPQPGARRALSRLAAAGHDLVLVTARRRRDALGRQLVALGMADRFRAVIATGGAPKDAALGEEIAARALRWIGDTEDDFASARRLRIPVTLVTNGIRNRTVLAKLAPDALAAGVGAAARG